MAQDLCRLCAKMQCTATALHLFDKSNQRIMYALKQITGIKLKNKFNMPVKMCSECENSLELAINFRKTCRRSQVKLRQDAINRTDFLDDQKQSAKDVVATEAKNMQQLEFECLRLLIAEREEHDEEPIDLPFVNKQIEQIHVQESIIPEFVPEKVVNVVKSENENSETVDIKSISEELALKKDESSNESKLISICISPFVENLVEFEEQPEAVEPTERQTPIIRKSNRQYLKRSKLAEKSDTSELKKLKKNEKSNVTNQREPKHICHLCGSPFYCLTNFNNHINRHNGEKTFACDQCPQKFYTQQMLKRHAYHHTGERPYACSMCPQRFIDKYGKVQHERAHANARPFKCKECGKAFNKNYVLKNHMLTHTGIREFSCTLCQRSFLQKKHLVTHYRSMLHKQNEEKSANSVSQNV